MTVEDNLVNGVIRYIDRRDGEVKTETIYGERPLRWVYGNPLGRLAQWLLIRRWIFSMWYGRRMDVVSSRVRIRPFIEQYGLDESEFDELVDEYNSFNEFFFRKLKPGVRPVDSATDSVVFPADVWSAPRTRKGATRHPTPSARRTWQQRSTVPSASRRRRPGKTSNSGPTISTTASRLPLPKPPR